MGITADLHKRLTDALGASIPVLKPEELRVPLEAAPVDAQGRPMVGGGERGLGAYLKQHPDGYVQIEQPMAITSDGLTGTFWVAVAALHTTSDGCADLAQQIRRALSGTPFQPGSYLEVTPAQPERLQEGVWMCRPTYNAYTLDGRTAAGE